jgi:hypothetical protein
MILCLLKPGHNSSTRDGAQSEESEGDYEAAAMRGVPHVVIITGSDPNFAEGALNHLLRGLRAFGFSGIVAVQDATCVGGVQTYEFEPSG